MAILVVPGARLCYEVSGAGATLLLIPGGPADGGVFAGLAPLLAAGGYRVVTRACALFRAGPGAGRARAAAHAAAAGRRVAAGGHGGC